MLPLKKRKVNHLSFSQSTDCGFVVVWAFGKNIVFLLAIYYIVLCLCPKGENLLIFQLHNQLLKHED